MADNSGFPFGGSLDLNQIMGQAQQLMSDLNRKKDEIEKGLEKEVVEAAAGGGMVKVKANALGRVISIQFDKDLIQPLDLELLQDVTTAAINEALKRAEAAGEKAKAQLMSTLPFADLLQGRK